MHSQRCCWPLYILLQKTLHSLELLLFGRHQKTLANIQYRYVVTSNSSLPSKWFGWCDWIKTSWWHILRTIVRLIFEKNGRWERYKDKRAGKNMYSSEMICVYGCVCMATQYFLESFTDKYFYFWRTVDKTNKYQKMICTLQKIIKYVSHASNVASYINYPTPKWCNPLHALQYVVMETIPIVISSYRDDGAPLI